MKLPTINKIWPFAAQPYNKYVMTVLYYIVHGFTFNNEITQKFAYQKL